MFLSLPKKSELEHRQLLVVSQTQADIPHTNVTFPLSFAWNFKGPSSEDHTPYLLQLIYCLVLICISVSIKILINGFRLICCSLFLIQYLQHSLCNLPQCCHILFLSSSTLCNLISWVGWIVSQYIQSWPWHCYLVPSDPEFTTHL